MMKLQFRNKKAFNALKAQSVHPLEEGKEIDDAQSTVYVDDIQDPYAGMSTVEYAIGTIAAAAFAGILYKVVTGGQIFSSLTDLIMHALKSVG